jgi:hypothetical protein
MNDDLNFVVSIDVNLELFSPEKKIVVSLIDGILNSRRWRMGSCFICGKETEDSLEGRTHMPPVGNYKIPLCSSCKENMGEHREKLREEVIRQVKQYA